MFLPLKKQQLEIEREGIEKVLLKVLQKTSMLIFQQFGKSNINDRLRALFTDLVLATEAALVNPQSVSAGMLVINFRSYRKWIFAISGVQID